MTEDRGWEWKNVAQYYLKVRVTLQLHFNSCVEFLQNSRLVPPADNHSTIGQVNSTAHGFGPVEISLPGNPTEIDHRVFMTTESHGDEFPFNLDLNSGNAVGIGKTTTVYLGVSCR